MRNLQLQKTDLLVCDAEFYGLDPPEDQVNSLKEMTNSVNNVIVGSTDGSSASESVLFGSGSVIDAYTMSSL